MARGGSFAVTAGGGTGGVSFAVTAGDGGGGGALSAAGLGFGLAAGGGGGEVSTITLGLGAALGGLGAAIEGVLAGGCNWAEGAVGFAGDATISGTAWCKREVGIPEPGINRRWPEYPGKERFGEAKPRDGP